ncbi:SDR family oxidoreductase [uncultured Friedmanniella sp.]|uniref:SDR family oxidoreductase n=1 Tax=uncultured Friedmanniella sp. TaxID=335381 RepID=UPI0035CAAD72
MNPSPPDPHQLAPVLVVGATGTIGGATLAALVARGVPVRVLVRRHQDGPAFTDVEQVVGDLADAGAVRDALAGVFAACYVSPHADDEEQLAQTFVNACANAGVRLVFVGVHVSGRTRRGRLSGVLMSGLFRAYRPKLRIGRLVEVTLPSAVLLVPTNFYDNDLLFADEILAGSYPCPLRGMNRVAVADVGEVAARVLLRPDLPAGTYPVCGPQTLSGSQSAAVWADVLGRPVNYTGDDPELWRAVAARRLPAGRKGTDYRASFRLLGRLAQQTHPAAVARTAELLGRSPLAYDDWVRAQVAGLIGRPGPSEVRSA